MLTRAVGSASGGCEKQGIARIQWIRGFGDIEGKRRGYVWGGLDRLKRQNDEGGF